MKRLSNCLTIIALLAAALSLTSCVKETFEPSKSTIELKSFTEGGDAVTYTANFTVAVTKADIIYYAIYPAGKSASDYQSIDVSADGDYSFSYSVDYDLTKSQSFVMEAFSALDRKGCIAITKEFTVSQSAVPAITVKTVDDAATFNSAQVVVNVVNGDKFFYTYYAKGSRPADAAIKWTEVAVEKDGDYTVDLKDLPVSVTDRTIYTFEAYAAKGATDCEKATVNFQTLKGSPVIISNVKASPSSISFSAEILAEFADAYCVGVIAKSDYSEETFLSECYQDDEYFWPTYTPVAANGSYVVNNLEPDTPYTLAVVLVKTKVNDWDEVVTAGFAGDVVAKDVQTSKFALGQSGVTAKLSIEETSFSTVVLKGTDDKNNCGGFYYGCIPTETLGSEIIESYIKKSDWFNVNSNFGPNYLAFAASFLDMYSGAKVTEKKATVINLKENTEYVAFIIAYDTLGFVGNVSSQKVTTSALEFNGTGYVKVTANPGLQDCTLNVDLSADCQKAEYLIYPEGQTSFADAQSSLLSSLKYGTFWESDGEYKLGNLNMETDYVIYILPLDKEGDYCPIQTVFFTTKGLDYSGTANVALAITSSTFESAVISKYSISITLQDGAAGCYWYAMSEDYVNGEKTAEKYAGKMFEYSAQTTVTESTVVDVTCWYSNEVLVAVPFDAAGKMGKPQMVALPLLKE